MTVPLSLPITRLWAPQAWVAGAWADAVLLEADALGRWVAITPDTPLHTLQTPTQTQTQTHAQVLPGPVLPGLVNAHSHAFQRAFVGLSESRDSDTDDFWSWRDRMYGVALRITPDQLQAVATHLYAELLQGGYTQVCEFHYLHHQPDGTRYADEWAMSRALALAAQATGIGLTLLPVLYERAGFTQPALRPDQRRFATTVDDVLRLRDGIRGWDLPQVDAGVAVHSLRAATAASLHTLARRLEGDAGPIHIHVAEQTAEVDDCLAATGVRPIEWLARELPLDARWQLVHATHATPAEIDAVAASGAGVVICPGTEANLGDGLCDLPRWLSSGTPLSVGSDSHVTRTWPEELRWLEYGQRLLRRQRNVAAAPGVQPSTAARLFERVRAGGGAAAGQARWGLQIGARADLLVLNLEDAALRGLPAQRALDAAVFAAPAQPFARVMVAGRWTGPPHPDAARGFEHAMQALWRPAALAMP